MSLAHFAWWREPARPWNIVHILWSLYIRLLASPFRPAQKLNLGLLFSDSMGNNLLIYIAKKPSKIYEKQCIWWFCGRDLITALLTERKAHIQIQWDLENICGCCLDHFLYCGLPTWSHLRPFLLCQRLCSSIYCYYSKLTQEHKMDWLGRFKCLNSSFCQLYIHRFFF